MNRQKIVLSVLNAHPDSDNRTLARLLHGRYPQEFETVERARDSVRYYRGAKGKLALKTAKKHGATQPHRRPKAISLPPGQRQIKKAINFKPKGRYLVLADLHVPFHDESAIELALRHGIDNGCEHVVLNGDFMDFYKMSQWSKDPTYREPSAELQVGKEVIQELEKHFAGGDSLKIYKCGNHEERFTRYLYEKAPALVGLQDFELRKVLPLSSGGWRFIEGKQVYRLGKLTMLHGHELQRGAFDPVNVSRGVFLRANETVMVGHWHRSSVHIETTGIKERVVPCYSLGCLCDLNPAYAPYNKWNHGFAEVTVGEAGRYEVENFLIFNGEVFST